MPQFNVRRIMLDHKQAAKSPLVQKFMDKCTSACDLLASFPMVSRHRTYDQDNQDLLPGSSARINNLLAKKSLKAQSCVNFKSFIFCFQFVRLKALVTHNGSGNYYAVSQNIREVHL